MALVNPNIALGIRQPEFTPRNAMAEYAQMQQVMNAQDAQQMNALKMQEARDVMTERNALRQLNPSASDYEDQLFRVNPTLGIQYRKERSAAEASAAAAAASRAAAEKSGFELSASRRKFGEDLKRGLSANPSDENIVAFGQDAVLQGLYSKDQVEATVGQLLAMPREERVRVLSQAGASAEALKPNIQQVNQGGQTQVLRVPAFGGQPTVAGTYADVALPAEVQAQNLQRAAASATQNIVKLPPLESAEQKAKGDLNVKMYGTISDAARLATRTLPAMETQAKILDQGFTTGFGTEVKKAGASVLAALGVQNADKFATDAQTFIAATQQAVLQKQLEQKGTQTAADADRITQTGAQLGNTVNGNRFIIDVAKAQLKRDIEQRNFFDNWWKTNKTYEGAENAWSTGDGSKSLFDRPELKKYAAPAAAPSSSVRSQADAILQRK